MSVGPIAVIAIVTLFMYGGLLTGTQLDTHETPYLYLRTFEYYQEISAHGFPPALFPDVIQRGGFAFPLFYPPASYLITTAFYWATGSLVWGVHFSLFLSVLLSSWAMYGAGILLWRKAVALPAALLYSAFPYRFVNTFVRGALAECWSFFWYPLILASVILILRRRYTLGIPFLAISIAGMITTHTITALYFVVTLIPMTLILAIAYRRWKTLAAMIPAAILTAGLIAWYIIPVQTNWNAVKATDPHRMKATAANVIEHAPDISQLFFTRPDAWHNSSRGSTGQGPAGDGMSFELGVPTAFALLIFCTSLILRNHRRSRHTILPTVAAFTIMLALIFFLIKPGPILRFLPAQFSFVQFSWRILGPLTFYGTLLFGFSFQQIIVRRAIQWYVSAIAAVSIISSVNPLHRAAFYLPKPVDLTDINAMIDKGDKGFVELADYVPRDYQDNQLALLKSGKPVLKTEGSIIAGDIQSGPRVLDLDIKAPGRIILPVLSYPVWSLRTSHNQALKLESDQGLLAAQLPQGAFKIKLIRTPAPRQVSSLWISAISLFACFIIPLLSFFRRRLSSK